MTAIRVIDKHSELTDLDYASSGHTGFSPDTHTHDDRYYTESEVDTISGSLNTKIDDKDNYQNWKFAVDGVTKDDITSEDVLNFVGGDNITVTRSADDEITISGSAGGGGAGDVTAAANITDNRIIRGDGGAKGIQESTITVSDDGEMVNTSQPAFLVYPASNQESIAVASDVTVLWGTERFDIGNNFASNTFTAPVTGKYQLNIQIRLGAVCINASYYQMGVVTSNKLYSSTIVDPNFTTELNYYVLVSLLLVDMDANDTVYVVIRQGSGAQQTDIHTTSSFFSSFLVC